jgi:hypothetical protein
MIIGSPNMSTALSGFLPFFVEFTGKSQRRRAKIYSVISEGDRLNRLHYFAILPRPLRDQSVMSFSISFQKLSRIAVITSKKVPVTLILLYPACNFRRSDK